MLERHEPQAEQTTLGATWDTPVPAAGIERME
jgi:hypothetical protein